MNNRPAFIVDGHQEQKIVQRLCPGAAVRMLNCNGDEVDLSAAAKRAASLIRLMGNRYYPFIIIFDREGRCLSATEVGKSLECFLREEGIDDMLIIGVPDRMIENWILADWENVQQQGNLRIQTSSKSFEGTHGKSVIIRLLPRDGRYQETIQGVDWFVTGNPSIMFRNSVSFRQFVLSLNNVDCRWFAECGSDIQTSNNKSKPI
jgi:hypothetical protein